MKLKQIATVAAVLLALGVLIFTFYLGSQQFASPRNSGAMESAVAPWALAIDGASLSGATKTGDGKMENTLAQIAAALRRNDKAALNAFAGEGSVDLKNNTVRVILEMDVSPEAHAVAGPMESVTLSDGRKVQVQQGSIITIRSDLAQAIATTGATYETAYENSVQVLAPFGSLEALTTVPGVRYVRLSYASR